MKVLHIVATPREQSSNTLRISNAFIEGLHRQNSYVEVDVIDLFNRDLPSVAGDNIEAKYHLMSGLSIDAKHKESWEQIEALIRHFLKADIYLISSPMWNFTIPYALKYFIDCVVQPGYLFKYDEQGVPIGLVTGKKMVCILTRGGDYSSPPMAAMDFQEPYLRAIFGFCGITDINVIKAQPMDITPDMRETAIMQAIQAAEALASSRNWSLAPA